MIKLTDDTKRVLENLRRRLDNLYYDQVQRAARFNYFYSPWPSTDSFEGMLQLLPPVNRLLYDLLLLGKTVSMKDVEEIFATDEISDLVRIGLFKRIGEFVNMDDLSILSFLGRYFLVSLNQQLDEHTTYMSSDSYLLAHNLSVPRDSRILDLCTGSGIQAILVSDRAEKVIGVEVDDVVANVATCNVALNNVEDKIEIRAGDLYEPVSGEQFDIICSNPPYMAVPDDVKYFLGGNGGPDGLRVTNRILDGLDDHLARDGRCFITATDMIGDEDGPLLEKKLRKLSEENKWSTTLILPKRAPIYYLASLTADKAKLMNDVSKDELLLRWKKTFEELCVNKTYANVVCIINKVNKFCFSKIDMYKYFREAPEIEFPAERKSKDPSWFRKLFQ